MRLLAWVAVYTIIFTSLSSSVFAESDGYTNVNFSRCKFVIAGKEPFGCDAVMTTVTGKTFTLAVGIPQIPALFQFSGLNITRTFSSEKSHSLRYWVDL
jgi:hypothetical protein